MSVACRCARVGVMSMGRYDDPNSGTSSFSMLLGDAPHLDMHYTIFGCVRVTGRSRESIKARCPA